MDLKATEIYKRFERLSIIGQVPTNEEWKHLEEVLYEAYPRFRDFMQEHRLQLTTKEHNIRTVPLLYLNFHNFQRMKL